MRPVATSKDDVCPVTVVVPRFQVKAGCGEPVAVASSISAAPASTNLEGGDETMTGAVTRLSRAGALVMVVTALVTVTS